MSIERNLRRAAGSSSVTPSNDPYWANVVILMNAGITNNSAINDRTVIDQSGYTGSFTLGSTTSFSGLNPSAYDYGSYYNPGPNITSGGITVNSNSHITFSGDFTVEFWAMVPSGVGQSTWSGPITAPSNFGFFSNSGASFSHNTWAATGNYSGSNWVFSSSVTSNNGVWTHCALVRSGTSIGNLKFYVNGTNVPGDTTTQSTAYNSVFDWNNCNIGAGTGSGPGSGDNQFWGYMTNIRFSNIARYTSNFTPYDEPFILDSNTMFLSIMQGGMLDVSNNRFPLLQNLTTPNDLQQSSTVQKFSGVNTVQGTGAGTNQDALTFPDEGTSYFPTNPMLQMPGAFTVECWVKATAGEYVFYGGTGNDLKITVSNSTYPTTFSAIFNYGGTNTVSYDSGISSLDNNWHFLAFVRNSSNVCSFYVDGVQTNTGTTYTYNFDMRRFQFMGNPGTSGSTMRGYTDQLRITNGVARYTGNFTPPTKPFPRY